MRSKELPISPQQLGQPQQVTLFHRSGFATTAHVKFEKDCRKMEAQGWRLVHAANVGNSAFNGCIVAIYQR